MIISIFKICDLDKNLKEKMSTNATLKKIEMMNQNICLLKKNQQLIN